MRMRTSALVAALGIFITPPAFATYLRMLPSYIAKGDASKKTVAIDWSIKNDGDEMAEAVSIDVPVLCQSYSIAPELGPQTTAQQSIEVPFSKLGISEPGTYSLIYRVTYKDANLYPFSAPYVAQISLPPEAGRVLFVEIKDHRPEFQIAESQEKTIKLVLSNVSDGPIQIEKIEPLSPVEFPVEVDSLAGTVMPAGAEKTVKARLQPRHTLVGSAYLLGAVVSGTAKGIHFSEPVTFVAKIVEGPWTIRNILLGLIAIVGIILVFNWAMTVYRRRKRSRASPRAG